MLPAIANPPNPATHHEFVRMAACGRSRNTERMPTASIPNKAVEPTVPIAGARSRTAV
jgi:hypothetical protein